MADIKISELGTASAVNNTDLFPITSNGVTVKVTAQQIKNYMGVGNLADLTTDAKTNLVAAIDEVDSHADNAQASANVVQAQVSNSGDAYSPSRPYKVGELCIYNNVLYRCTTDCSAGSWATNQSCFTQDTLVNAENRLNEKTALSFSPVGGVTVIYNNSYKKNDGLVCINIKLEINVSLTSRTHLGKFYNFGFNDPMPIIGSGQQQINGFVDCVVMGYINIDGGLYLGDYVSSPNGFRQVSVNLTIYT